MTQRQIVLHPRGINSAGGWRQLDWEVTGLAAGRLTLRHAVPEVDGGLFDEPERGDAPLAAVLICAMQEGSNIVVEGAVSPRLIAGLETVQSIWQRWRPTQYRQVAIRAAFEQEATVPANREPRAVCAFSGGVDASFTLFRHLHRHAGRLTRPPAAALLVHGMDIPLAQDDAYRQAADKAESMLADTGIKLIRMQSNARMLGQQWEDSFGLILSACFLTLQHRFAWALRGSEEPYDALVLPWGSTPLTDPLCSTAAMRMEHDGCGFDRSEKVAWLAAHTHITSHLRVCWEGPDKDRNCGQCEKCIRTMLNFWSMGLTVPEAFPTELTPQRVRSVRIRNEVQLQYIRTLYRHAAGRYPRQDRLLAAVRALLRRASLRQWRHQTVSLGRQLLG